MEIIVGFAFWLVACHITAHFAVKHLERSYWTSFLLAFFVSPFYLITPILFSKRSINQKI